MFCKIFQSLQSHVKIKFIDSFFNCCRLVYFIYSQVMLEIIFLIHFIYNHMLRISILLKIPLPSNVKTIQLYDFRILLIHFVWSHVKKY